MAKNARAGWDPASFGVLEALADAVFGIGFGSDVKQALVGFGVLHDGRRPPLHGQYHRAFGLLELFHEVAGPPAECRQGLNVIYRIEHGVLLFQHPF